MKEWSEVVIEAKRRERVAREERNYRFAGFGWAALWSVLAVISYLAVQQTAKQAELVVGWIMLIGSSASAIACAYRALVGSERFEKTLDVLFTTVLFAILSLIGIAFLAYLIFGIDWTPMEILIVVVAVGFVGVIDAINRQKRRD